MVRFLRWSAFVLMPDGHLLTLRFATDKFHQHSHFAHGSCSCGVTKSAEQKVGKDSPKRTKVLLENSPSGGLRFPPSAHLRRALSPLNALKGGSRLRRRGRGGVRVSSGQTAIQTLPSSSVSLCPHAGRAPTAWGHSSGKPYESCDLVPRVYSMVEHHGGKKYG